MSSENFYSSLPRLENFRDITDLTNFQSFPPDWYILVTDIIRSTEAIEAGRYKEVNLIGASCIIAILNVATNIEIPFVFGGDGASILIPPSLLVKAKQALLATQKLAQQEFRLDLRIGAIPVADVLQGGQFDVKVAKVRVSENYSQGIFMGGGLTHATDLIKDATPGKSYQIKNTRLVPKADFSGLECRWQDIPSRHGEVVSLLVLANPDQQNSNLYKEVLEQIQRIYGSDEKLHPIHQSHLNLSFNFRKLYLETKILGKSRSGLDKILHLMNIQIQNLLGLFFIQFHLNLGKMDWGDYKNIVSAATDYRKFDDMLRMVIAGNSAQRAELTRYLEKNYREGMLVYGLHMSNRAIMTCIVFERNGRQVHFVDGADGGYASAAKAMKARMNDVLMQV